MTRQGCDVCPNPGVAARSSAASISSRSSPKMSGESTGWAPDVGPEVLSQDRIASTADRILRSFFQVAPGEHGPANPTRQRRIDDWCGQNGKLRQGVLEGAICLHGKMGLRSGMLSIMGAYPQQGNPSLWPSKAFG
jgi:hypothetical protein